LRAAQEDVLDAHVDREDIGIRSLVVRESERGVVPFEQTEDRLLRLVLEQQAQLLLAQGARLDQYASEVRLPFLLRRERHAKRLFGDPSARDEEVAEHVRRILRSARNDPPFADEYPLHDLVPLDGQGSGLAGVTQPLEDFGQGHCGQTTLDRHRAPRSKNLGRMRSTASRRGPNCPNLFRHLDSVKRWTYTEYLDGRYLSGSS
jgi:hypothetical protein